MFHLSTMCLLCKEQGRHWLLFFQCWKWIHTDLSLFSHIPPPPTTTTNNHGHLFCSAQAKLGLQSLALKITKVTCPVMTWEQLS